MYCENSGQKPICFGVVYKAVTILSLEFMSLQNPKQGTVNSIK